jgi:hypothetical protein
MVEGMDIPMMGVCMSTCIFHHHHHHHQLLLLQASCKRLTAQGGWQ